MAKFSAGDRLVMHYPELHYPGIYEEEYVLCVVSAGGRDGCLVCLISSKSFNRWTDAAHVANIQDITFDEMKQIAQMSEVLTKTGYYFTKDGVDIFPREG